MRAKNQEPSSFALFENRVDQRGLGTDNSGLTNQASIESSSLAGIKDDPDFVGFTVEPGIAHRFAFFCVER
jgi:hypothetical protein